MLIKSTSNYYLKKIRAKAKMYEYGVPEDIHINVEEQANDLIILCIGIVGDIANIILDIKEAPIILSRENKEELYFASKLFDSYFQTQLNKHMNPYFLLMGSVTFYFANMNGSSRVMLNSMSNLHGFDFEASGLEKIIIWILDNSKRFAINDINEKYREFALKVVEYYNLFFDFNNVLETNFTNFREYTYNVGNNREILLVDIILAVLKKKTYNSCINLMPKFSNIDKSEWIPTFRSNTMMKEMWESQILLGRKGIFVGKSAVVQMPTSSGKTASISLAIQSSFLSNRTSIVVVVAPFRALCKEIQLDLESFFEFDGSISVTEFSDIPEGSDLYLSISEDIRKKVFVMTPEKFDYILKHDKEIVENIKMIVFDEAHLFDDEQRGTNYELLLTTINNNISKDTQKILVSAVISNAEELNSWINKDGIVISNNNIKTSEKTVAFNSFFNTDNKSHYSNLYFVNPNRELEQEFYVPRVVKISKLGKKLRERKDNYFPDISRNKQDVGIYFAIKLIRNGCLAIYCSKKSTVNTILTRFIDLKERGVELDDFLELSDIEECKKIANLIQLHLGEENILYKSALLGIVGHHAGVPNGVRISEEYALKNSLINCVVCTSTLAQGVNLPIKYLIVSSIYQSREIIKVRDFHNLIGRTARAGKETEGTIILTEDVYNNRESFKLKNYKRLLNADNSERCSSNLLKLVRNIKLMDGNNISITFLKKYISLRYLNYKEYCILKKKIIEYRNKGKENGDEILFKINEIDNILVSLENFILSFSDNEDESVETIKTTYGYYLANDEEREELLNVFNLIKSNIKNLEIEDSLLYRKSMLGIRTMIELSNFVGNNILKKENLDYNTLLQLLSDYLSKFDSCKILQKLVNKINTYDLLKMWLDGKSYLEILNYSISEKILIKKGKNNKLMTIEDIFVLCDLDFAYASLNVIQTIIEILKINNTHENEMEILNDVIRSIRYGLPDQESIFVYELGFSDRILAQKISALISNSDLSSKSSTKHSIINNKEILKNLLLDYPTYFTYRLNRLK